MFNSNHWSRHIYVLFYPHSTKVNWDLKPTNLNVLFGLYISIYMYMCVCVQYKPSGPLYWILWTCMSIHVCMQKGIQYTLTYSDRAVKINIEQI